MKIKLLKGTNCDGVRVRAGDTVEASERDGKLLIALGFAVPHVEEPRKAPTNRMAKATHAR